MSLYILFAKGCILNIKILKRGITMEFYCWHNNVTSKELFMQNVSIIGKVGGTVGSKQLCGGTTYFIHPFW